MSRKLRYGLKDGKLREIDSVERGLACGCVCPECGAPLMAKQGKTNEHHFAHARGYTECATAPESALHLMAKNYIYETKTLSLPEYKGKPYDNYRFDFAEIEKTLPGGVRADIYLHSEGKIGVNVEVLVTHKVDEQKRNILRKENIWTVEIDLGGLIDTYDEQKVADAIRSGVNTTWIYNDEIEEKIIEKEHEQMRCELADYICGDTPFYCFTAKKYKYERDAFEDCHGCYYWQYDIQSDTSGYPCVYRFKNINLEDILEVSDVIRECGCVRSIRTRQKNGFVTYTGELNELLSPASNDEIKMAGRSIVELWEKNISSIYVKNMQTDNILCVNHNGAGEPYCRAGKIIGRYANEKNGKLLLSEKEYRVSGAELPIWIVVKKYYLKSNSGS